MTHKTISVTMANDDAFALFEIGAAFQRIAQRHGLEAPAAIPHEEAKVIMAERKAAIREALDTDKAQLSTLGEECDAQLKQFVEAVAADWQVPVDMLLGKSKSDTAPEPVNGTEAFESLDALASLPQRVVEPEPTNSPQLDADGLPWDARIHSDSHARNADNTWRARRKPKDMDESEWTAYVSDTRAELKRVMELPVEQELRLLSDEPVVTVPCGDGVSVGYRVEVVEPVEPEPIVVVPPPPAPAPVETVAPPAPTSELPTDFIGVLQWLTGNGWKSDVVDPVLVRLSLGRLQDLQARPDMIPAFCTEVLKGV